MYKLKYLKQNYFLSPVKLFLSLGILVLTIGCVKTSDEKSFTYFGGKIKNPGGEYIYFSKDEKVIDSAKIDKHNKFSFRLDSIEIGLYTFNHGPEYQFLYLEPKDSLLIYLNTWDFDESLIFSGTQAAKNNYLINLFLEQEKFEKNFKRGFELSEEDFSEAIDKEIKARLDSYDLLVELEGEEPSEFFEKIAKAGIYFPFYYLKEHYPFKNKRALQLKTLPVLSDNFYSYRETIDLNDKDLINYGPYYTYVLTYLHLKAYKEYLDDSEKNNVSLNYMKIVNSEITDEDFKNRELAKSFWTSLTSNYMSEEQLKEAGDYFFENCTNKDLCSEIKRSVKQKAQMKKGGKLPKVIAYNTSGEEVSINNLAKDSDAVIYFWPKHLGRVEMLDEKLASLKKQYPDILFIGIERDKTNEDWVKFIDSKNLSEDSQFILSKDSDAYAYFEGDMARTIIVKSNGNIHNGYLFFNDKNFDVQLKKLNKQ